MSGSLHDPLSGTEIDEDPNTNPFPGLRPFEEDEQHLFFGRESQVDAMVDKLALTRFLAVVGTSGSGKSSLVNCGLRPALSGGLMAGAGTAWRVAQFRPGNDPMVAMARALAKDGVLFQDHPSEGMTIEEIIDTTLRMSKLGLIDIVEQAHLDEPVNLLIVVDQFEELFRYHHLETDRDQSISGASEQATAFINLLLAATEQSRYPIYIVLTMRSDFLGDCAQFQGLAEAINNGQYLVPRLTRDQRRAAISGPIEVGGAKIAPVLLTRLVNDVGDNPDQLSILQHALNRTWAYWENEAGGIGPLDLPHYESIGSMARALDQHAEKAFAELETDRQREICEQLFKALTDKATDARGVRRPTRLQTLCALTEVSAAEITQVIDVFRQPSRSFLMPPANVELQPDTVVDISHESLMRVWQRLQRWATDEAESARMYRRLTDNSALFEKKEGSLWRDPELRNALQWRKRAKPNQAWAERYDPGYDNAMSFLKQSEKSEVRRRGIRAAVVGSVCALVLAGAGYFGIIQYQEQKRLVVRAEKEAAVALEKEKTAVALAKKDAAIAARKVSHAYKMKELAEAAEAEAKQKADAAALAATQATAEKEDIEAQNQRLIEDVNELSNEDVVSKQILTEIANQTQEVNRLELAQQQIESLAANADNEKDIAELAITGTIIAANAMKTNQALEMTLGAIASAYKTENQAIAVDDGETKEEPEPVVVQVASQAEFASVENSFATCTNVDKLKPIDCKTSFPPGKVYLFARIITPKAEEKLTLSWYTDDETETTLGSRQLTVKRNPKGYRTYTWKGFDVGDYKACIVDQSGKPMTPPCLRFAVN